MADVASAVHKAIFEVMAGITAPAVSGPDVGVPVYDHQPENVAFPFIVLSSQTVTPDDTLAEAQAFYTAYLSVWSLYRGQRQVLAILSAMRARLHNASLALDDGESLLVRVTSQATSREPDDITYQGSMTVTVTAAG